MPETSVAVHSFPECKAIWMNLDSETQELVLACAARICGAPCLEADDNSSDTLRELGRKGLILQEEDEWRFARPTMLFYVQAMNLIALHSMQAVPPSELLPILEDASSGTGTHPQRSSADRRTLVSYIIVQLINEFDRLDLLEMAVSQETSSRSFWLVHHMICDSLPILDLTVEEAAEVLKGIAVRGQGDMVGGRVYWAAEYLGYLRPDFARKLVDHFLADNGWESVGFLESLMTGIARASPTHRDAVIAEAEGWLDSGNASLSQASGRLCGNLISSGQLQPEWLLSRVDSLVSRSEEGIRHATSTVIAQLGASFEEYSDECLGILARLKELGPPDQVTRGISVALAHADHGALEYRMSCLRLLADLPIADKGTIDNIGWILFPISRDHPGHVWSFLERWILEHALQESVSEHDMFLSTIQQVHRSDPGFSALVLTRWFSSSDPRLVEEARSILHELGIDGFDSGEIGSLPAEKISYITEKLLVGRMQSLQILRLLGSILFNTSHVTVLREYLSRVLGYLAWNFPAGSMEFFNQVIGESETESEATSLVETAREELLEYQKARKGVFVAELAPSKRRAQRYQAFEGKQMQEAYEKARDSDRFPFQKLFSRVMIGRGDRTFHMDIFHPDAAHRRTFREPSGFGEISHDLELPRGEFLDPEGEVWRRAQRLQMKPGDTLEEGS